MQATSEIQVFRLDTYSASPVSNSQPAGIGRLAAIEGVLVINNLGRNIELSAPTGDGLIPIHLFQDTAFPDEDEPSQFDLDMHAVLACPDRRCLIAVNHYGIIRLLAPAGDGIVFAVSNGRDPLTLTSKLNFKWPGDAERFVFARSCLISSSPRGYAVDDAIEPGVLVSESWQRVMAGVSRNVPERFGAIDAHQIRYRNQLADWGIVTAVALSDCMQLLAVAAGTRLGVFRLCYDAQGEVQLESQLWERHLSCVLSWLHFCEESGDLLAGGHSPSSLDDNGAEWEALTGGVLGRLDRGTGKDRWLSDLKIDLAWGNGGDPLTYVPGSKEIAGVDRTGALSIWNLSDGRWRRATRAQSNASMGIAHMTLQGNSLYCGFNRGGYHLFRYGPLF